MFLFEESKKKIAERVEDFDKNINIIKKGDVYKEANIEDEFIKPMFKYLNWNISNESILNISDREFIVQAKGKGGKEPDYLLQLDGKPCFYMEAKHPKYDLVKETRYIWQAYSYAYSTQSSSERKKVDFSLLTDFEEFRLFDCTFKAEPSTVNNFVTVDWKYSDYIDRFSDLWDIFERENVRKGSFQSLYLNEKKIKVNRIPPDKAFLSDLDDEKTGWRILLAKDIKKFNPEFSAEFITKVIQLIIDRFVFIKVLSDREIEDDFLAQVIEQIDKASLKSEEGSLNESCKEIFTQMNKTYNGSIFEPRSELDIVKLSNKTLRSILKSLLPENSRYNFKVIPVEILGTIYEQFLGKVVITTEKRASIEYKPEVRRAGGVYYTPQYIVDYIVENTVGKILHSCKSLENLFKIKVCDPACGSGSFLLSAYDHFIRWATDFYFNKYLPESNITKKDMELVYKDKDGSIRLTGKLKRDILRNCIYGVDIDSQAVEVTRMSLSLKALEETHHDELYNEVNLFHEAVLPDLSGNIKCGNSLINRDQLLLNNMFGDNDIIPFDWESEFPEIFKNGGFDCIVGNPPYIRIQEMQVWAPKAVEIFKKTYESGKKGNFDIYVLFIEQSINLINTKGYIGFILPHKFFNASYGENLRGILSKEKYVSKIVHFGDIQIFEGPTTYTCLLFLSKSIIEEIEISKVKTLENWIQNGDAEKGFIKADTLSSSEWNFNIGKNSTLFEKLNKYPTKLKDIAHLFVGLQTDGDDIFILEEIEHNKNLVKCYSKATNQEHWLENEHLKYLVKGSVNIRPYTFCELSKRLIFPYITIENKSIIIDQHSYKNKYPLTWEYLEINKKKLLARNKGNMGTMWYGYVYKKNHTRFDQSKILVPSISSRASFAYDEKGNYYFVGSGGGGGGGYGITLNENSSLSYEYILGLLNSRLLDSFLQSYSSPFRGGYFAYNRQYIEKLPIFIPDPSDKSKYDHCMKIEEYVINILKLKKDLQKQADAEFLERKIDDLVEKIYGD